MIYGVRKGSEEAKSEAEGRRKKGVDRGSGWSNLG